MLAGPDATADSVIPNPGAGYARDCGGGIPMQSTDRSDPVILGHVLGEHRELHAAIAAVRCLLEKGAHAPTACIDDLVGSLNILRSHLAEHFAKEERGGFLEESIARVPRLSKAVASIMADHPRLLAEIDALIESIPTTSMEPDAWRSCWECFDRFAGHLVSHERNENAVVQEGYNEDLGLMD
jgi:iron-sulfur cluster repair protein YtfE (RIC family)